MPVKKLLPILIPLLASVGELIAQPCDETIQPSANQTLAYKPRKNRCEGFFTAKVSRSSFELVGCTLGDFRFRQDQSEVITLEVPGATDVTTYNIRAKGIPATLYYQMDAQLQAGKTLVWEVATSLLLDPRSQRDYNIGLLAYRVESNNKIYSPVKSKSKLLAIEEGNNGVKLKFVSSRQLAALKWGLDGGPYQDYDKPLPASGQPISISLPYSLSKGLHSFKVAYRALNSSEMLTQIFQIQL